MLKKINVFVCILCLIFTGCSSKPLNKINDINDLKNKNVFVFTTSGVGMKFYNNKLIKALEARGAINKGSFSCKGSYDAEKFTDNKIFKGMSIISKGHPNNRDLKKAQKFFIKIISSL